MDKQAQFHVATDLPSAGKMNGSGSRFVPCVCGETLILSNRVTSTVTCATCGAEAHWIWAVTVAYDPAQDPRQRPSKARKAAARPKAVGLDTAAPA